MSVQVRAPNTIQSLDVFLQKLKVGTLVRTPGDLNAFSFDPAYRAMARPPILSLSLRSADGGLRKDPKPAAHVLPAFFANMLPEDRLREAMEKHHAGAVRPGNDFDLLAALGEKIPEEFNTLSTGKVLLVKRFDRGPEDARIHIEDFAQVFGRQPSKKYDDASYHDIASALNVAVSTDAALEFVRRLALAALVGNGDMHLKNWSTIYPGDGCTPAMAPVYDVLSTTAYFPKDDMALSLGGEKSFKALTPDRWRKFANRARLPDPAVISAVKQVVSSVNELWWNLPERDVVPTAVLEKIDAKIRKMSLVLDPS